MKVCCKCKESKELNQFNKNKSRKDGYGTYCKECAAKSSKDYYESNITNHKVKTAARNKLERQKRQDYVTAYKAAKGCKYCPEKEPCCLDLHHRKDKLYDVSTMIRDIKPLELIDLEIAKCDVACRNCHAKIHAGKLTEV